MPDEFPFDPVRLARAMADPLAHGVERLSQGYQGAVYLYEEAGRRYAVKVALGHFGLGWLTRAMLRREHRVYLHLARRLASSACVFRYAPRCFGLHHRRYLVLGYLEGHALREHDPEDRERYYATLLAALRDLHARGVAHGDLKRKSNQLVVAGEPRLVDFGTAIIWRDGFAPINHFLFNVAVRFDFNAWAKHKSRGRFETLRSEERALYRPTVWEQISRLFRKPYKLLVRLPVRWRNARRPP